jgi:hypothetical protein
MHGCIHLSKLSMNGRKPWNTAESSEKLSTSHAKFSEP